MPCWRDPGQGGLRGRDPRWEPWRVVRSAETPRTQMRTPREPRGTRGRVVGGRARRPGSFPSQQVHVLPRSRWSLKRPPGRREGPGLCCGVLGAGRGFQRRNDERLTHLLPTSASPSSAVVSSRQVNVYVLGKTFLLLARELCINAPAIGTAGHAGTQRSGVGEASARARTRPLPGKKGPWEGPGAQQHGGYFFFFLFLSFFFF